MQSVQTVPQSAADHTEALNRETIFDDGAGHKMMAVDHVAVTNAGTRIFLAGVTGGDGTTGAAY